MAEKFKELNTDWLLTGNGSMTKNLNISEIEKDSLEHELVEKFATLPEDKKKDYFYKLMAVMVD